MQVLCRKRIADACERFIYDKFNKKVQKKHFLIMCDLQPWVIVFYYLQIEMPIDKAIDTLLRLDLVSEFPLEESTKLKVVPCSRAHATLKQRWDSLLSQETWHLAARALSG